MHAKYCAACGALLKYELIEGRNRGRCSGCNRIHYEQLIIGAGALIETDHRLLLLRRTEQPFKNCWGLPAGHVEADEAPSCAAIRETEEEIGLRVKQKGIIDAYFFDDHPAGCGIFLVYRCEILGGALTETSEADTPTFFSPNAIPRELAGAGHSQAIMAWRQQAMGS
jgi:ADP-ribose pyrophosphatase YjhB (NUDIX family)